MKTIVLTACLLVITTLNAQNFEWAKSFGGTSNDRGSSISTDASGNVYTTGKFVGTVDFDPGAGTAFLTSEGQYDIFVQKMDASGNFHWAKSFGGIDWDSGNSISVDASGNIYTTGSFIGTVDFDPGAGTAFLSSEGQFDIFVQKMDSAGNYLWAKSFGGTELDFGSSIRNDSSGNVYTTGSFRVAVDFDPGTGIISLTSAGLSDIFVQKMDASGNFLWAKSFGGTDFDYCPSITSDASGNVYTIGYFWGTVDFDPGAGTFSITSEGSSDIFVQKMDASGNFLWARSFHGTGWDVGFSISTNASGNIYSVGFFQETVDFDPGAGSNTLTSAGEHDIFVQKMDASGNFLWAKSFGGTNNDVGKSTTTDASGNVYTIGYFEETVDFDPGAGSTALTSEGGPDIFVQKMDASGNFLWAKSFGGIYDDDGYSISTDASGNVYTTGEFEGSIDFDPGAGTTTLTSAGSSDIFVHKMSQCQPTEGTDIITSCYSFTWIDGITYTSSNNTATYTLTNAAGCDSIVTLNLTINSVSDITTTLNGITITANNLSAAYQWLDCNNSYAQIVGETNQSYTATQIGSYAVELTENGCTDTSACVEITNVGIVENTFGEELKVYRSPNKGSFSLDLGLAYETSRITINDINGRLIYSKSFIQTQMINLAIDEPVGVYFITVNSGDKKAVIKLMKE